VSDEQHMALPQLYGGPAYSRPPRPALEIVRPFDPDELPLEAHRTDGEGALAVELTGATWAPASAPPAKPAKVKGVRRSRAAKPAKAAPAKADPAKAAPAKAAPAKAAPATPVEAGRQDASGPNGLQGRPFNLRSLGRIFGGERK
jgi:hypothetical protein